MAYLGKDIVGIGLLHKLAISGKDFTGMDSSHAE